VPAAFVSNGGPGIPFRNNRRMGMRGIDSRRSVGSAPQPSQEGMFGIFVALILRLGSVDATRSDGEAVLHELLLVFGCIRRRVVDRG